MEELIFGILQYLSSGMFLYVLIFFLIMDQFALGTSIYFVFYQSDHEQAA